MISDAQRRYFQKIEARVQTLTTALGDEKTMANYNLVRDYNKELAKLEKVHRYYKEYERLEEQKAETKKLLKERDKDLQELASAETDRINNLLAELETTLTEISQARDENDDRNAFMELRSAAGGDESAIFVSDLLRMYQYYAEKRNWELEIVTAHPREQGGHRLIVMTVKGKDVFAHLKFESGTHRVQRVPKTETQGRLHTSTCTVAVFAEAAPTDNIKFNKTDLRIDTYRASGAGGQHINKTDSAVRITHLPTGITVECQEQRSQHRNKEKALELLSARLLQAEKEKRQREETRLRRSLVGSGDRAEKVRTYNFPQNRVTDHRLPLTLYSLGELMLGDMDPLIKPLVAGERSLLTEEANA